MRKDSGVHKLVYDYYKTRILFGYYKLGDRLPSISKICSKFHLGRASISAALSLLEKEGYIQTEERKAARVAFQVEPAQVLKNAADYYVPRWEGIRDFSLCGQLLFEPLWEEGLRRWDRKNWELLCSSLSAPASGIVPLPIELYIWVYSALENKLILNLYWEGIRYIRFPYLASREERKLAEEDLKSISREEAIVLLNREFKESYGKIEQETFDFIEESQGKYGLQHVKQIPFQWNIYRQRPQLRYTLAARVIREIFTGKYPVGSYLPSLPKMAEQYGVALSTVRRTLNLLEKLGVTKSFHGKGTQIRMEPIEIDFNRSEIHEGLRLYQESLQLMALTIRQVSLYTLQNVPAEKRRAMARKFIRILRGEKKYLCTEIYFAFLEQECPLAMVRECYGKSKELLDWGYPFILLRKQECNFHAEYGELLEQMGQHLLQEDLEAFADDWKCLMEHEEQLARSFIEKIAGGGRPLLTGCQSGQEFENNGK